jgi:ornithine--oxo-acid transaminase
VLASREILGVFTPGTHGSTFGGNPLGAAVAREALKVLVEEGLIQNSASTGEYFLNRLRELLEGNLRVRDIRGKGLFIGVELKEEVGGARPFCEELAVRGLLCKETHEDVIRFAPPLIIDRQTIDWALGHIVEVLNMPLPDLRTVSQSTLTLPAWRSQVA